VRVAGAARFQQLRAGLAHTCALSSTESVACWGANRAGQLGDATTRDRATPALVAGLRAGALAVGWNHTCALTPQGAAFCWGENGSGQLGDGSRAPRTAPAAVAGGRRFVAIAAWGQAHVRRRGGRRHLLLGRG
jgi:alpha-tubulin suppressor-like RCC1 family protein